MVKFFYNWISSIDVFLIMFFIAKYMFLKLFDIDKRTLKKLIIYVCALEGIFQVVGLYNEDLSFLCSIILFEYIIFKYENKNKIKSLFVIIPVIIVLINICFIVIIPGFLCTGSFDAFLNTDKYYSSIIDIICWILIIIFLVKGKKVRDTYEEAMKNRKMDRYEKFFLYIVGIFLFIVFIIMFSIPEMNISLSLKKVYMLVIFAAILTSDLAVIVIVIQRNKKFYYQTVSDLNEYYLKAQINHFKNYQKQQIETRRIKHDMKNHLILLNNLAAKEKIEEVQSYISELLESVYEIDNELHTGNQITDAIINEKNVQAKQSNITLVVEGSFMQRINIEPIDLCTIFSNALDNAIEYLQSSNITNKKVLIKIISKNSICMIIFKNKVNNQNINLDTSKKDKLNHGFGIENIKRSVEKYNGKMDFKIDENSEFSLEVIFANNSLQQK